MAFTYSGNPNDSQKDEIRFILGDYDESSPLLQDAEINFALRKFDSNIFQTAIYLCRRIVMAASNLADSMSGLESVRGSQIQKQYSQRILDLQREMSEISTPNVFFGGIDIPAKFTDHDVDNPRVRKYDC